MWLPGAPSDGRAAQAEEERGCPRTVHLVGPQCKISHVTQPAVTPGCHSVETAQ